MNDSFGNLVPEDAFIIRATEIGEFRNCRRKWMFQSHNGLNLESSGVNVNLRFGIAWHKALEVYYDTAIGDPLAVEITQSAFECSLDTQVKKIEEELSHKTDAGWVENFVLQAKEETTQHKELGFALIEGYIPWAQTTEPSDANVEVIAVERRLLVPVYDDVYLAAKVDALVDIKTGIYRGSQWIMEHKTTSKSTRVDEGRHLPLDLQVGLQLVAESIFSQETGRPAPIGTIYNLTRKQMPTSRVVNPIYWRHPIMRSTRELGILRDQLEVDVLNMKAAQRNEWECYPNPFGLSGYCGWGCAVRSICEGMNRGEAYEYELEQFFKPRERNIFETLEDEMKGVDSEDVE